MALILEDHAGAQAWLREVLGWVFPEINVSMADSLSVARARLAHMIAAELSPDIALVDLSLPDGTGIDLIRDLRETAPDCLCIVVTIHDDDRHVFPALRAGATGYLLKQQSKADLARRLRGIVDGEPPLSPSIAKRILSTFAPVREEGYTELTPREREVLALIAKGFTLAKAGAALEISRHTTAGYVKNIYRKLEVSSRAEATREAVRMGLIEPNI